MKYGMVNKPKEEKDGIKIKRRSRFKFINNTT